MNELLKTKLQPFIQTVINMAIESLDDCIQQARKDVEAWELKWGIAPNQPMLDIGVQERIRLMIRGEEILDPTKLELTVAGDLLQKAIANQWSLGLTEL